MGDRPADDLLGRAKNLADAEAATAAEIADEGLDSPIVIGRRRLERPNVGIGKIGDVDVVADACPVGRLVIRSEQGQRLAPALRRVK